MDLQQCNYDVVCDSANCTNKAEKCFSAKVYGGKVYLCGKCLKSICAKLSQQTKEQQ